MQYSRRNLMVIAAGGALGGALLPFVAPQAARADTAEAVLDRFTGGATPAAGDLRLVAPEIAENGNAVSIEIEAPGAVAVLLVAPRNPAPEVLTWQPGALSTGRLVTRIRMAETQELIAVARMDDGAFVEARARVQVTVGGCTV